MQRTLIILICSLSLIGCAFTQNKTLKEYNDFAIKSADMGLWDEAILRWKKLTEVNPDNAKIHNNLAVAYEAKGDMESAMSEYNKAIKLDPKNRVYSSNYTRFKQNYDKLHKNDKKEQIPEQKT